MDGLSLTKNKLNFSENHVLVLSPNRSKAMAELGNYHFPVYDCVLLRILHLLHNSGSLGQDKNLPHQREASVNCGHSTSYKGTFY